MWEHGVNEKQELYLLPIFNYPKTRKQKTTLSQKKNLSATKKLGFDLVQPSKNAGVLRFYTMELSS